MRHARRLAFVLASVSGWVSACSLDFEALQAGADDAATPSDGGTGADGGGMNDDAGPGGDAGPGLDAGPAVDAGPAMDAGPSMDAGPAVDAGPAMDASSSMDAGPGMDAGPDAGPPSSARWVETFGSFDYEQLNGVASTSTGAVVIGSFQGTVDFGGVRPLVSEGQADVVVAAYDGAGTHRWSARFGDPSDDTGYDVAVDTGGDIYVVGMFQGDIAFGSSTGTSRGANDIFVAKLDPMGTPRWSRTYGSSGIDYALAVDTDASGNVYVAGLIAGPTDFGGGTRMGSGGGDLFVLSLTADGAHRWSIALGDTQQDGANALAVASDAVYVAGYFRRNISFGGPTLTSLSGSADAFVVKLGLDGAHQWSQRFGGTMGDVGEAIAVHLGNVYVGGYFSGTVDFGSGPEMSRSGSQDIFVVGLTSSGSLSWARAYGGVGFDALNDLDTDGAGNVHLIGTYASPIDFGGGPLSAASVFGDVYVTSLSSTGAYRGSVGFGGAQADFGFGVAADGAAGTYAVGAFRDVVDFGVRTVTSGGEVDAYLLRLAP